MSTGNIERALIEKKKIFKSSRGLRTIYLSQAFWGGENTVASITFEGLPEDVDSCIERFMNLVCKCTHPAYQLFMMYDLAFANPTLCRVDGDLAYIRIPRMNYERYMWVAIFELPPLHRLDEVVSIFVGTGGQTVRQLQCLTGCSYEVTAGGPKPHVVVRSFNQHAIAFGMKLAKQRLAEIQLP